MSGRGEAIVTCLVLLSVACIAGMVALFACGQVYWGTCAGIGACYSVLLGIFLEVYAG